MPHARIITGAHVLCHVNGRPFGRVRSVVLNPSVPTDRILAVDGNTAHELADGQATLTGSIGLYRTIGDGGAEGAGIATPFSELPRGKYFSILLLERVSDSIIFEARFCRVTGQSWPIVTRDFAVGTVAFEALTWNNEIRPNRR